MKNIANLSIIFASIAIAAVFAATYSYDYRWIGHVFAGVAIIGFLAATLVLGTVVAGRMKRPPSPLRFILHRKIGIAFGLIALATFLYGLWIMLPQGKTILETLHGWLGLIFIALALVQVVPSLFSSPNKSIKTIHRWLAYTLGGLLILQVALGMSMLPAFTRSPPPARFALPWQAPMQEDWIPDGVIGRNEYVGSRAVDNGNFEIFYRNDGIYIYVGMKAKTTGWMAIGTEKDQGMLNAGMVVGYVSEGNATVIDSYGVGQFEHLPDTELGGADNIIASGGKEENGWTVIEFKMAIITGDKYDTTPGPGIHNIIWAYGATDELTMHVAQGHEEVSFEIR